MYASFMTTIEVLGTCHHDCPDSCGWVATATDGVVTKVKGNPDHPYSAGELCPKINRLVSRVNSDDRILTPLIRAGEKGAGEFRVASWDEALALVVDRVRAAVDEFGGEAVYPWFSAGNQGLIQRSSVDRALFSKLGSSVQTGSVCGATMSAGVSSTYGRGFAADPLNLVHAELVVLWGTNTRLTNRHLWPYVEQARDRGAKVVVIDPLKTITADSADQHIQPLPGTDVALMLAVMHVLVAEDLVDLDYVGSHAEGYDELVAHVRDMTPEWAADQCGLDAAVIREFARAYGRAKPAFIRTLIGPEHHERGAMFYRTVSCLPVLTGSWRELGGGMAHSLSAWPGRRDLDDSVFDYEHLADGAPRRGLTQAQLGEWLTELNDPPVKALFAWNGNPLASMPNSAVTRRGLERDDLFTVVSEQFMTDTARYADVIFPAATQVENLDVVPSWGHLWLGWNEPATAPRGEAVANTELFRRLGTAFGFTESIFSTSDEDLIHMALGDHVDREELRSQGFVRVGETEDLMPYANGGFNTVSGRALLVNNELAAIDQPTLPTYIAANEGPGSGAAQAFPLVLATPKKQLRFLNTTYSGDPGHRDKEKGPFLELDEIDAAARGLADGDMARVFNDRAELRLEVRLSDRLRPGLASVPWGFWADAYDNDGLLVNDLTNDALTDWGGGAAYGDTLVEVATI